jgi:hypothetical protein
MADVLQFYDSCWTSVWINQINCSRTCAEIHSLNTTLVRNQDASKQNSDRSAPPPSTSQADKPSAGASTAQKLAILMTN